MKTTEMLQEFVQFLQLGARLDLKAVVVENILGLTGTEDGIYAIVDFPQIQVALISLLDDNTVAIAKDVSLCLINISANARGAQALIDVDVNKYCPPLQKPPENIVQQILKHIFDQKSKIADQCCTILSNLSRISHLNEKIINCVERSSENKSFDDLINIFTRNDFNPNAKLHYLGPVLSNLSQSSRVRRFILDKEKCVIQRLLPFTEYRDSKTRRGGIIGTLKNCCFEDYFHEWLLSDEVDILPRLLLPLAGPEEFDEEDNDKLPLDLQYLPEDKTREEDPDIRCMLLEAITQLCTKKDNREYIRDKNTYVILRELHKWEKDKTAVLACENLVDILIRTEDEIGKDNLKQLDIPTDVAEGFEKMNKELIDQCKN